MTRNYRYAGNHNFAAVAYQTLGTLCRWMTNHISLISDIVHSLCLFPIPLLFAFKLRMLLGQLSYLSLISKH